MQKVIVVYNPRASKFGLVSAKVLEKIRGEKGLVLGKFEIKPTNPRENAENLAKVITGGELVVATGGDGTASIAMNGVILAREKNGKEAIFTALPYGNFNDLPRAFGDLNIREILKRFKEEKTEDFYPIKVRVNGEEFWNFGAYFTAGMMAESTRVFEDKKVREKLKTGKKGLFFSARTLFLWYMKNKRRKFLPEEMTVNGINVVKNTTDYIATNGGTVARVLKIPKGSGGKEYFKEERKFFSGAEKLTGLFRLFRLGFIKGILQSKYPGGETEGDLIRFKRPARVFLHAEGEAKEFKGVLEIIVEKLEKPIKVIRIERRRK